MEFDGVGKQRGLGGVVHDVKSAVVWKAGPMLKPSQA